MQHSALAKVSSSMSSLPETVGEIPVSMSEREALTGPFVAYLFYF
jgi:hypothetical protein